MQEKRSLPLVRNNICDISSPAFVNINLLLYRQFVVSPIIVLFGITKMRLNVANFFDFQFEQ